MSDLSGNLPEAMQHYFRMWNELESEKVRGHLEQAVSEDCLWVDPQNAHTGRDALEQNVHGFREKFPLAKLELGSNVDSHHQRYRYEWTIKIKGELLIRGFDVSTLNDEGQIARVDGFFGELSKID